MKTLSIESTWWRISFSEPQTKLYYITGHNRAERKLSSYLSYSFMAKVEIAKSIHLLESEKKTVVDQIENEITVVNVYFLPFQFIP